jgi:quinol monooxygenase YgiN
MVTKGLLVRLEAKPGKDHAVEEQLATAVPLVDDEPGTSAWFGVRLGRSKYAIFDVFPDEEGRAAHLNGAVAAALRERADELFARAPDVVPIDVLADKLPGATTATVTKGLLLTWAPRSGHEEHVAAFLRGAQPIVAAEPGTIAWFAIRLPDGRYGIFDVFASTRGRSAHLTGRVPREIAKNALSLLGSVPRMAMLDVLGAKLPRPQARASTAPL